MPAPARTQRRVPQTGKRPPRHPQRPLERARPPGSRRATCRAISPSCRRRSPPISCASASSTRSPARCSRRGARRSGLPTLGDDLDIRTDLPRYKVFRNGELIDEPTDIARIWRDDLVIFALGCSFSFEDALMQDGIELRHITNGSTVPMYRTSIATTPAGPFHGPLVVSMRPLKPADAIRAIQITTRFPAVHGAPVHIGKPELIGINDIMKPDYGDPVAGERRRDPGVLGLRRDAAIGGGDGEAGILHHPLSGLHAGDRSPQHRVRDHVRRARRAPACGPTGAEAQLSYPGRA